MANNVYLRNQVDEYAIHDFEWFHFISTSARSGWQPCQCEHLFNPVVRRGWIDDDWREIIRKTLRPLSEDETDAIALNRDNLYAACREAIEWDRSEAVFYLSGKIELDYPFFWLGQESCLSLSSAIRGTGSVE